MTHAVLYTLIINKMTQTHRCIWLRLNVVLSYQQFICSTPVIFPKYMLSLLWMFK